MSLDALHICGGEGVPAEGKSSILGVLLAWKVGLSLRQTDVSGFRALRAFVNRRPMSIECGLACKSRRSSFPCNTWVKGCVRSAEPEAA